MSVTDCSGDICQIDALGPSRLVPLGCELSFGVCVPLRWAVDVLEADKRSSTLAVGDRIHRYVVECGTQGFVDRWDLDAKPLRRRYPAGQFRFAQQSQRRKPPVAFQHHQLTIAGVGPVHNDQRLDVHVAIGGDGLEQLVELRSSIQPCDEFLIGCLHALGVQPRIPAVEPKPFDRHLRDRLKFHRNRSGDGCRSYPEHLHHLVAEVVDDLDRDAAGDEGRPKGREVSLLSVDQASSLISALRVVLSAL